VEWKPPLPGVPSQCVQKCCRCGARFSVVTTMGNHMGMDAAVDMPGRKGIGSAYQARPSGMGHQPQRWYQIPLGLEPPGTE
jgi:hypothetical protein